LRWRSSKAAPGAARLRAARQVHGFLVVVGKAFTQGADHILLVGAAGQHDRLEQPLVAGDLLQRTDQLDTIALGHVQVAEHQADGFVGDVLLDGLVRGMGRDAAIAFTFQPVAQLFDNQRLVVDNQHFHFTDGLVHDQLPVVSVLLPGRGHRQQKSSRTLQSSTWTVHLIRTFSLHWIQTAVRRKPAST
jgi:hypothetical protein